MISIGAPPDPVQVFKSRIFAIGDTLEDILERKEDSEDGSASVALDESLVEGRMEECHLRRPEFTHSFTVEYRIKRQD